MISDFTTNLIKDFLLNYTSSFAKTHISSQLVRAISVPRAYFSYDTERWMPKTYQLPVCEGDYVILTPKDILTKDETWINHSDMVHRFEDIPNAVENDQLRAEINNYFYRMIPRDRDPTKEDYGRAIDSTLAIYPQLIDYYIKLKEERMKRSPPAYRRWWNLTCSTSGISVGYPSFSSGRPPLSDTGQH